MSDIHELLQKYYKAEGQNMSASPKKYNAEQYTNEYNNKQKREANRKHRHQLLNQILTEIPFTLNKAQTNEIKYWIDKFNPYWKQFHRQASNETIILAFIIIQQKQTDKRINPEQYTISQKYNLTNRIFTNIQNELIFQLMRTTPLTYNKSIQYNHEILEKKNE